MKSFTKILSRHLDGSIAVCYYDIVLVLNCGHGGTADALASGASGGNPVEVQVLLAAPI
jgi:hypothetical protein